MKELYDQEIDSITLEWKDVKEFNWIEDCMPERGTTILTSDKEYFVEDHFADIYRALYTADRELTPYFRLDGSINFRVIRPSKERART